ncbi:hypothetical protein EPUS_09050 [Endocarpon pusillum Z07020]|uniref:Uncharacterized protein n=1 Tax=Endocarpon pusillum (strain Z07020 / HMAS-L-300199) TaxID=1263415 RepID=U1GGY4_ENDPU|nr:uncharacterized protein EPUS_09050 [Endocarpon pusillum Z07020]ERF71378.1 hypothetical protein EPUS_09050 [Endocarpon pusillum Z07020]
MSTKTHPVEGSDVQPFQDDNSVVMESPSVEAEGGVKETIINPPEQESVPRISLNWTLDPTPHSFSTELPPTICLILTSHANKPITIYNEALNPSRLLSEGKFPIFDQTDNIEVPHRRRIYCDFEPPSKIKVPLREKLFHTLYPAVPGSVSRACNPFRANQLGPQTLLGGLHQARSRASEKTRLRGGRAQARPSLQLASGTRLGLDPVVGVRGEGRGHESAKWETRRQESGISSLEEPSPTHQT